MAFSWGVKLYLHAKHTDFGSACQLLGIWSALEAEIHHSTLVESFRACFVSRLLLLIFDKVLVPEGQEVVI